MRINQFIAHNSHYSRREADKLIIEGRVNINRERAVPGQHIHQNDKVFIDSICLKRKHNNNFTVIAYHKVKGEIVSKNDEKQRHVVFDSLPKHFAHFCPVGRLDFSSEGLLLLSDSSRVVEALMKSALVRSYYVKIKGTVGHDMITAMEKGICLKDATKGAHPKSKIQSMQFAPFFSYEILKESKSFARLKIQITEGQNRELRRFFAAFNADVMDLKRVAFGFVSLNQLKPQKWRFLTKAEYNKLHKFLKENETL